MTSLNFIHPSFYIPSIDLVDYADVNVLDKRDVLALITYTVKMRGCHNPLEIPTKYKNTATVSVDAFLFFGAPSWAKYIVQKKEKETTDYYYVDTNMVQGVKLNETCLPYRLPLSELPSENILARRSARVIAKISDFPISWYNPTTDRAHAYPEKNETCLYVNRLSPLLLVTATVVDTNEMGCTLRDNKNNVIPFVHFSRLLPIISDDEPHTLLGMNTYRQQQISQLCINCGAPDALSSEFSMTALYYSGHRLPVFA